MGTVLVFNRCQNEASGLASTHLVPYSSVGRASDAVSQADAACVPCGLSTGGPALRGCRGEVPVFMLAVSGANPCSQSPLTCWVFEATTD